MSAWIVSKAHIDALVWGLGVRELLPADPNTTGAMLWAENHRSVNYRYSESTPMPPYAYAVPQVRWNASQLAKIASCYDYQTCETDDYRNTDAGKLVNRFFDALVAEGADRADADAPWGLPECGHNHGSWEECAS